MAVAAQPTSQPEGQNVMDDFRMGRDGLSGFCESRYIGNLQVKLLNHPDSVMNWANLFFGKRARGEGVGGEKEAAASVKMHGG